MDINKIEADIQTIEQMSNWSEKVTLMKSVRERIKTEQNKVSELINQISKDEIEIKKKKKVDIDTLINDFNNATDIEEKIKIYQIISYQINEIEKSLFC